MAKLIHNTTHYNKPRKEEKGESFKNPRFKHDQYSVTLPIFWRNIMAGLDIGDEWNNSYDLEFTTRDIPMLKKLIAKLETKDV